MKPSIKKRIMAIMLCIILVSSYSVSAFADEEDMSAAYSEDVTETGNESGQETISQGEPIVGDNENSESGSDSTAEGGDTSSEESSEQGSEEGVDAEDSEQGSEDGVDAEGSEQGSEEGVDAEDSEQDSEEETEEQDIIGEAVREVKYEDDDVIITITADSDGIIPENTTLRVVPILSEDEETKEQYEQVETKLNEKAETEEYNIAGFLAYDISFINDAGEEIEPNGKVKVTIEYKEEKIPDGIEGESSNLDITVMHLEEDELGEVQDVVDMVADPEEEAAVETTEDAKVKKAEFETDSFSYYTVTWTASNRSVKIKAHYGYENSSGQFVEFGDVPAEEIGEITQTDKPVELGAYANQDVFETSEYIYSKAYVSNTLQYSNKRESAYLRLGKNGNSYYLQSSMKKDSEYSNVGNSIGNSVKNVAVYYVYAAQLTTAETIDHMQAGITMRMIDMEGGDKYTIWTNETEIINLGGVYTQDKKGSIKYGLLENRLAVNGYPVSTGQSKNFLTDTKYHSGGTKGQNLETLFSGGRTVNHLFRKDIYDTTGYFEYSSFENYAYLENDNNFTVYNQIGTPDNADRYFYKRGNFMPYNRIEAGKYSTNRNLYDENGNKLNSTDARYNELLYKTQDTNNYKFGMYMGANFIQPKNGVISDTGESMRYEFNGDDDLWIFIDNVLALDIGGVHDAHSGYIDFSTGEVGTYNCYLDETPVLYKQTIKEMFREAEVFPDGTQWDDSKADDYFSGDTFKDFTIHSFKMLYMERGAGASNLHMKFNLQVIPEGQFEVTKRLTNTDKENYANVDFAFQAYAQKIESIDAQGNETYSPTEYVRLDSAVYKDTGESVTFQNATFGEGENAKTYSDVFYLKPDQTAVFKDLKANRKYYVAEVGVNAQDYDKIVINGTEYKAFDEDEQITGVIADIETDEKEVVERPVVVCENNCSLYNSRELRITKRMAAGQSIGDTFSFKIQLTDQNGSLVDYANGNYYLVDSDGYYYFYNEQGQLTKNEGADKTAIICGRTDENGIVAGVPADYTVIITQILSGTGFLVQEVDLDNSVYFEPVKEVKTDSCDPSDIEGADGMIALGKDAEVTITNTRRANTLSIKKVDADDGEKLLKGAVFELQMWDGQQYAAVIKDNEPWRQTTDETGIVTFTNLEIGSYKVVEVSAPEGYVLDSQNNSFEVQLPYVNDKGDAAVTVDESSKLDNGSYSNITKTFTNKKMYWEIIKRSVNSDEILLPDAEFTLSSEENTYYGKSQDDGKIIWYTTNDHTVVVAEDEIIPGTYTLSETRAPAGYEVSTATWTIKIGQNGAWILASGIDADDQVTENNKVICYFENTPIYVLPSAGGTGIYGYSISGLLLMLAAALILYKNRRKEVLRS